MRPASPGAWYSSLLGLLVPVLLLGFMASALANRIVFAGWAVVAATLLAIVLRRGFESWRGPAAIAWPVALVLGAALGVFALLVARHQEILDLGYRAVFPGFYTPWLTRAMTFALLGGLAAGLGAAIFVRRTFGRTV